MTQQNVLTDRRALERHRKRADTSALFLQDSAADELQDRLSMVNRPFRKPAIVTPFPGVWDSRLIDAKIIEDTDTLDLEPGAHDLVIHSLSLHWANDPVGQIIQCRRALQPDGLLLIASLGGQTLHELRSCIAEAEVDVVGGLSPRVAAMGEIRDLGGLLQRGALALPVADSHTLNVEYQSAWHLMRDLRAMGESNALAARQRTPTKRAVLTRTAELYAQHFQTPEDRIKATFELVFLTGWAPDDSQQKPLRPGSAKQRLADALAVPETRLPD